MKFGDSKFLTIAIYGGKNKHGRSQRGAMGAVAPPGRELKNVGA